MQWASVIDAVAVEAALELSNGNRSEAAMEISRPTLHAKMDKYGIHTISSTKIVR